MSTQDLAVTLTGGTQEARTLAGGLITQALDQAGFTSVTNSIEDGDQGVPTTEKVQSILSMCKATAPHLFDIPVFVEDGSVGAPEASEEDAEGDDEETPAGDE